MLCSRIIREGVRRFAVPVRHGTTSILSTDKLDASVDDKTGVCRLVMQNGPVNVLEKEMMLGIRDVVVEADKSPNISSLVLSSAIPNIFCAGLDIQMFMNVDTDEKNFREYWGALGDIILTTYLMRGVSVAAIDGTCVAGGLAIALACDYRITTQGNHKLGFTETKLGINCPFFVCEMFKQQCGMREAMSALPYAQLYDVTSAHRVGLVEEVCPPGDLKYAVDDFLHSALAIPSEARFTTKLHLRQLPFAAMKNMMSIDMEHKVELFKRPEVKSNVVDYLMSLKAANKAKMAEEKDSS